VKTTATAVKDAAKPAITINGICEGMVKNASPCAKKISRQQFDTVIDTLKAAGQVQAPAMRRSYAQGYVELTIYSNAARKAGVEKDPRYPQILELARMRALTDMYRVRMEEEANKISPAEIEAYYKKNIDRFEELQLRRVALPRFNSANLKDDDFAAKAKKAADEIRERAANGEDLDKLQGEAFETLGLKKPPATKMGPVRRGLYNEKEETTLFAMKPGDVSKVVEDASAFIIFKMEGRGTLTLEQSKGEIRNKLYLTKLEALRNAVSSSLRVEYDEQYFGPEPPTAASMPGSAMKPPAAGAAQKLEEHK
jgi:hypothetical protein